MEHELPSEKTPPRRRVAILLLSLVAVASLGAAGYIGVDAQNKSEGWQEVLDRAVIQRDLAIDRAIATEDEKAKLAAMVERSEQDVEGLENRVAELSSEVAYLRDQLVGMGYGGSLALPSEP